MSFVIVPNSLRDEIYRKVDAAIAEVPESDRTVVLQDRECFFRAILEHFHKHGDIPDFSLEKNGNSQTS